MKNIFISVINDISTDQRVHKIACTLLKADAQVTVAGRKLKYSLPINNKPYKTKRFRLLINKGPLFYAFYNIRLFFFLIFRKADILIANDLDTLLANYLVSVIKRKVLVYDSHELFTEVPELINRKLTKKCWQFIEKKILPKIKYAYTVSESISNYYRDKYGIEMSVVRNLPYYREPSSFKKGKNDDFTVIYQGALNMGRGIELVIKAMKYLEKHKLLLVGDGDITGELKKLAQTENASDKIIFTGRVPHEDLMNYTTNADLGISLEEDMGLNYRFALPNKLFNYIQARIPVLVSDLPEMAKIVKQFNIGEILYDREPQNLADVITGMRKSHDKRKLWADNLDIAAKDLCWEKEEKKLMDIYKKTGLLKKK